MSEKVPDTFSDTPEFPRWVRILAVAYVLSIVIGPAGFFLLCGAGIFR